MLAAVLCLALCSCNAIKEMRQSQAFYGENGEIIWGGQVYKQLSFGEFPEELEFNISGWGNVTEKDVPVLLSEFFGADMYYNHNKTVIETGSKSAYYAREDVYDYVQDLIKYPYISDYCVEIDDEWTLETSYELLKERYLNAIDEIIYGGNELSPEDENYFDTGITSDYADIYKCDEKMVFQSLAYRIEELENGDMVLSRFTGAYGVSMIRYRIPDDKKAMMKELLTLGEDGLF